MEIKYCESGDRRIAVGTGNRPIRWCRECYVKEHGAEFVQCKVTVADPRLEVACARTGKDVGRSGVVWLDPAETNIIALVYGGIVEEVPGKAKTPAKD